MGCGCSTLSPSVLPVATRVGSVIGPAPTPAPAPGGDSAAAAPALLPALPRAPGAGGERRGRAAEWRLPTEAREAALLGREEAERGPASGRLGLRLSSVEPARERPP